MRRTSPCREAGVTRQRSSGDPLLVMLDEAGQRQHAQTLVDAAERGLLEGEREAHMRDAERIGPQLEHRRRLRHVVATSAAEAVTRLDVGGSFRASTKHIASAEKVAKYVERQHRRACDCCMSNIQQAIRQKLSRSENQALSRGKRIKF